jgi:glycosyltransferase involved in cell wall biosynthesis
MEAMMAGVPAVATDISGNRDLVVPEQTGYLVSVGDSAEFARKTTLLLDDPKLAHQLGSHARKRMLEEFSIPLMVNRYAELYRELVL